jgi:ribonuclease Z
VEVRIRLWLYPHNTLEVTMSSDFKVTLLGTGSPRPRIERFGPSTLVEAGGQRLLFDCGRGTIQRIYQLDQNTNTFDKLFLTHLHADHTTGIPDLWVTGNYYGRFANPLRVWGTPGTEQMIEHIKKAYEEDVRLQNGIFSHFNSPRNLEGQKIEVQEIDEGFVYDENGVRVSPFRVNHHDFFSDEISLGYRVDYCGRSVVLSGDTRYCENLIEHSRGVDLLVHEVASGPIGVELTRSSRIPLACHTLPEECGLVFSEVRPKLAVYYHVVQFQGVSLDEVMNRTRREYGGRVVFGEDLMRIEVGESVKILQS